MDMDTFLVLVGLVGFGYLVVWIIRRENEVANRGADKILCPHCQTRGSVTVRMIVRGKGISGGKATGALLTGGASMLATGLSKNQNVRRLSCSNCAVEWDVE